MNATTTTTKTRIRIVLSEQSPVSIDPDEWALIAQVENYNGEVRCQANTEWAIRVREHADGRRLVYGFKRAGRGGQYVGFRELYAGYIVPTTFAGAAIDTHVREIRAQGQEDATIRAIRRVAGVIEDDQLGAECIADLPAREI